ncbi:MAG TPA: oxidoreductase [bacterium]|nr:oxidoreductase [bacterium]
MADKPKVAIYWLTACGGCDEAIVDLNEAVLQVADAVDIVLWPVAMDFKYSEIKKMKKNEITLSIIHGSVRNSEQKEMAEVLREKSQIVLAFGSCSCFGGTPGLANFRTKEDIFNWVYQDSPTVVNPNKNRPQAKSKVGDKTLTLPEFFDHVYALDQVIDVDYYLPGCPPPPDLIANAVFAVVEGKLPPRGSTLAPDKPLCDSCPRNATKPLKFDITEIKRPHEVEIDSETCFLAKGVLCMGPATRSGCGETCLRVNTPCRGCFGPVEGVDDMGSKFLSALASLLKAEKNEDVENVVATVCDPAGYFYRFTQPTSILGQQKL